MEYTVATAAEPPPSTTPGKPRILGAGLIITLIWLILASVLVATILTLFIWSPGATQLNPDEVMPYVIVMTGILMFAALIATWLLLSYGTVRPAKQADTAPAAAETKDATTPRTTR